MAIQSNVGLFGSATRTNCLLVIQMLGETHPSEVARILEISLSQAQKAVESLERASIVVSVLEGRTRRVRINPRYPYSAELASLLDKIGADNLGLQSKLSEIRRRPRRQGKEI